MFLDISNASISDIDFSSNLFEGSIPLPSVPIELFDLSNNRFQGIPDMSEMKSGTCVGFIFRDLSGNLQLMMGVDTYDTTMTNDEVQIVAADATKHIYLRPKTLSLMSGNLFLGDLWFNAFKQSIGRVAPHCTPDQLAQKIHHILKGIDAFSVYCGAITSGWYEDAPFLIENESDTTMNPTVTYAAEAFKTIGSGNFYADQVINSRIHGNMNLGFAVEMTKIALTYASHMDPRTGGFAKVFYSAGPASEWVCISTESLDLLQEIYSIQCCEEFILGNV